MPGPGNQDSWVFFLICHCFIGQLYENYVTFLFFSPKSGMDIAICSNFTVLIFCQVGTAPEIPCFPLPREYSRRIKKQQICYLFSQMLSGVNSFPSHKTRTKARVLAVPIQAVASNGWPVCKLFQSLRCAKHWISSERAQHVICTAIQTRF